MALAADKPHRILSFDGGGVHALSYLPVLEHLEQHLGQGIAQSGHFDMLVGTSTGAIVAMAVKLGCPAEEIIKLYLDNARGIFRKAYVWNWLFYKYRSKYLRDILADFIGRCGSDPNLTWGELSQDGRFRPDVELVVTLWDVCYEKATFLSTNAARDDQPNMLRDAAVADVITACCSGPYYFPPRAFRRATKDAAQDGNYVFCDGGITGLNNPAAFGVSLVRKDPALSSRLLDVISFGSGETLTFQSEKEIRRRAAWNIGLNTIEALMSSSASLMDRFYKTFGPALHIRHYLRTNQLRPPRSKLDDVRIIGDLVKNFDKGNVFYHLSSYGSGNVVHSGGLPAVRETMTSVWADVFGLAPGPADSTGAPQNDACQCPTVPPHTKGGQRGVPGVPLPLASPNPAPRPLVSSDEVRTTWSRRLDLVGMLTLTFAIIAAGGFAVYYGVEKRRANEALEANQALASANEALTQAHERTLFAQSRTRLAFNAVTDDVIAELLGKQNRYQLGEHERAFLRKVLGFYQQFAANQGDTPQARRDQADGYLRVGILRQKLGELKDAEAAFRQALALGQRLVDDDPQAAYRADVARVQSNLGALLFATERHKDAEAAHREALSTYQNLTAEFPTQSTYADGLAGEQMNLGNILRDTQRPDEAEAAYREAVATFRQLAADFPAVPSYRQDLAKTQNNRGMLLNDMRRRPEAEAAYRDAIAVLRKLIADFPTVAKYRDSLVRCHHNLGHVLAETGRPREAEEAYREALTVAQQLAADFPMLPDFRQVLAFAHIAMGMHLADTDRSQEAEAAIRDALAVLRRLAADIPTVPRYREALADAYTKLGILLRESSRMPEAETAYREAAAIQEKLAAEMPNNPEYRRGLARTLHNIGALFYFTRRHTEALAAYQDALARRKKLAADYPHMPEFRRDVAKSHETLGMLLEAMGQAKEAEAAYREALALWQKLAPDLSAVPQYRHELAGIHMRLGTLLRDQSRPQDAEAAIRDALALWQKLAADYPAATIYANNAAAMLVELARQKNSSREHLEAKKLLLQARPHHRSALEGNPKHRTYRASLRGNHFAMCNALAGLGEHAALVKEAEELARLGDEPARGFYDAACFVCLGVPLARQDAKLPEAERQAYAKAYAERAMALLSQAAAAGFKNVEQMKKDSALAPLREREDFRKLQADLEAKAKSSPPKNP